MGCKHCLHCHPLLFKHGARVRYKVHIRGRTKQPGIIKGHPRAGSVTTYVVWPDAWSGHERLDLLEVVPAPTKDATP
jgi:hypothetical protein